MKSKEEYRESYLRNRVIEEMLIEIGTKTLLSSKKKLDGNEIERRLELKLASTKRKNKFEDVISEEDLEKGEEVA